MCYQIKITYHDGLEVWARCNGLIIQRNSYDYAVDMCKTLRICLDNEGCDALLTVVECDSYLVE